jgi:transcriptional regulator with XRE-family HTH domain
MVRDSAAEYFGRALAAARSERGLKRMQLKERSGLSYPYISEIENGGKYPSQRAIQALADALGMTPSELVGRAERIQSDDLEATGDIDPDRREALPAVPISFPSSYSVSVSLDGGDDDDLVSRLSEKVILALQGPLRDLVIREVQMTVREELLRQRNGR